MWYNKETKDILSRTNASALSYNIFEYLQRVTTQPQFSITYFGAVDVDYRPQRNLPTL